MKVLAINSSPNKEKGNTSVVLTPFLDGMREAGADVELYYTSELSIHPCTEDQGTYSDNAIMNTGTNDIEWLIHLYRTTDVLVLASPVYWGGITGSMKIFIDSLQPVRRPELELWGGTSRYAPRNDMIRRRRIVLVSSAGCWEHETFDPVLAHIRAISFGLHGDYIGALIRPHADSMKPFYEREEAVEEVVTAARQAGRDLQLQGSISHRILDQVSRDILPRDEYIRIYNQLHQPEMKIKGN